MTEGDISMVILIGGTGCTGKTLLASQLMKKTNISYFALDHLMMAIYRGMPNCGFAPMDGQFILGEQMWPIIKGLIMTNIENDHNIILEGFQLLPYLVKDFSPEYQKNILVVFLFFSEQYIQDNFNGKIIKYRSAIESRSDIDDLDMQSLISDTKRLKEQCVKSGVAFFEIKDNYDDEMKEVQDLIVAQLRHR